MSIGFLRNALFNLFGGAIPAFASLLTVPIIVSRLGEVQYGVFALVTTLVGYFAILDINATAGSIKYLAEHRARGDGRKVSEVVCFGAAIYAVIGLAGAVEEMVRARAGEFGRATRFVRAPGEKADAFAAARAGLIKSGTSSLEAAVAGLPHVVAYRVNPISAAIARRLIQVPHVSLVNLLCGREVVPELLQQDCTPEALHRALEALLDGGTAVEAQRAELEGTLPISWCSLETVRAFHVATARERVTTASTPPGIAYRSGYARSSSTVAAFGFTANTS